MSGSRFIALAFQKHRKTVLISLLGWLTIVALIALNMKALVNLGGSGKLIGSVLAFPIIGVYWAYCEGEHIMKDQGQVKRDTGDD
jgi:hypothetical protein